MKTVKKRTLSIIHELIGNEELMTLSELAEKFEVSQRTIRNDLKLINELLKEMDLGKIRLVGGRIICPSSFGQVLKAVPKDDLYTYKLSQEERIEIAASFLINTVEYITMSVIADNLVVSRSTVINDLSKIKAYIGQGNLKVLSHPNKGLRVEGKESDKRLFLMNIKGNGVEKEQKDIVESIVLKQLNLRTDSWQKIREILYEAVYLDQSRLREDSFEKIVLYLGIMIHRNQQGSYIEIQKRQPNSKYRMAQNILIQIAKEYFISHKEDEVQFLSELLICEKFSGYVSEKNEITRKEMKEQLDSAIYEAEILLKKSRRIVKGYFSQSAEIWEHYDTVELHHFLPASHIQLGVECQDWKEIVENMGRWMYERGYVEKRYVASMIENTEKNGPYIVVLPGFAIPHDGQGKGSIISGMYLVSLRRPIPFGVEKLDPVEFVCCFSAMDLKVHMKAFFSLISMFRNNTFKRKLRECKTSQDAAHLIEEYEFE